MIFNYITLLGSDKWLKIKQWLEGKNLSMFLTIQNSMVIIFVKYDLKSTLLDTIVYFSQMSHEVATCFMSVSRVNNCKMIN